MEQVMPDSAPETAGKPSGLPEWDLSDLYAGTDDPQVLADLDAVGADAKAFREAHAGRLDRLKGDALAAAIAEYERIDERLSKLTSFAQLLHAGNVTDAEIGRFYQDIHERANLIGSDLLFFKLEINRLEEGRLEGLRAESPALAHYWPWLRDVRVMRPHQLSDDLEKLLHEKSVTGRAAWTRLFDQSMAGLRFSFRGEALTNTEILNKLSDPDRSVRREAAETLGAVLGDNGRLFALIMNTLVKDKEVEDRWRGFARPVSSRNLANLVEDEVVDALVSAVREAYPRLSHRYYRIKARWLGVDRLQVWDRLAPLPEEDDREISWDEAVETVLGSYDRFSGELAAVGRRFFDHAWIDAPPRSGKASGAFAHPTVPSAHPYLLLNYQGRVRDVMTLAHELGHGVHQVLAGGNGHLMARTPLTLAETASVFGEMLTFQGMLARTDDPARRRAMLAAKVEDMLNTVVRQTSFFEFERRVHDARRKGELTADRIGEIWLEVSRESLGDAFEFAPFYNAYWMYIPHFVHTPFYVYAYAFGDCLVNALYSVYESGEDGFVDRYLDMLRAGGAKRHGDLLAPFRLDASDPAFWGRGLGVIERLVDELEASV